MYLVECSYCGKTIQREKNVKTGCCFDCRMERQREVSLKSARKKRKLNKLINKQNATKRPNTKPVSKLKAVNSGRVFKTGREKGGTSKG